MCVCVRLCADVCVRSFLGSLRARLKQLHPSANCSLGEDHMVHVHFKEEIGIAELIPLVTTYIILFAYIYFSTREFPLNAHPLTADTVAGGGERLLFFRGPTFSIRLFPDPFGGKLLQYQSLF